MPLKDFRQIVYVIFEKRYCSKSKAKPFYVKKVIEVVKHTNLTSNFLISIITCLSFEHFKRSER